MIPGRSINGVPLSPPEMDPTTHVCREALNCAYYANRWAWFPDASTVSYGEDQVTVQGWWQPVCHQHAEGIPEARLSPRRDLAEPRRPKWDGSDTADVVLPWLRWRVDTMTATERAKIDAELARVDASMEAQAGRERLLAAIFGGAPVVRCVNPQCPEHGDHEALYAEPPSSTADVPATTPTPLRRSAISPADGITVRGDVYFRPVDSTEPWQELGSGEAIIIPLAPSTLMRSEGSKVDADGWCVCSGHQEIKLLWHQGKVSPELMVQGTPAHIVKLKGYNRG